MKKMIVESKFKRILRSLCLSWIAVLIPIVSYPDQPESTDYVVRFDRQRQQLTVAESNFMPALDIQGSQKEVSEFKVNPATLTKIGGTDMQPLQLPAGRKTYRCRLGKALYRVVIEPYIFNTRVMGQCGAADPVISLSVSRNGKQLFSKIDFANCYTGRTIYSIQVSEPARLIKVLALLVLNKLNKHAFNENLFYILKDQTIEKDFGWVFFCATAEGNIEKELQIKEDDTRPIIVNKYSHQVIANLSIQPIERIVSLYEKILMKSKMIGEEWCLTPLLNPPLMTKQRDSRKKIKERSSKDGFYEIT